MVDVPIVGENMAQGLGYASIPTPTTDAAETGMVPENSKCTSSMNDAMYLTPVSLATDSVSAPPFGAFLMTNLHDENYSDPRKPHISPESQKG